MHVLLRGMEGAGEERKRESECMCVCVCTQKECVYVAHMT